MDLLHRVKRKVTAALGKSATSASPEIPASGLKFNVERAILEPPLVRIRGWAWSMGQKPETEVQNRILFTLVDAAGQTISFENQPYLRPDVAQVLFGQEIKIQAGFQIVFRSTGNPPYRLLLQDGANQITHEISELTEEEGGSEAWTIGPGYPAWLQAHTPSAEELTWQRENTPAYAPLISCLMPVYRTPEGFLREMLDSLQAQSYPNWELCIADGSGDDLVPETVIREYAAGDARIRYERLEKNLGISENTNAALAMARGEWIALLDHDDLLAPDAFYEVVQAMQDSAVDFVYTDEDKVSLDSQRYYEPHFKPDYNPDYLLSCNYITHLSVIRASLVAQAGGFDANYDGSQDYDFILRCTEKARKVAHIPKPLYHWRMHLASTAEDPTSKMYCYDAGKRAIEAHLKRIGQDGYAEISDVLGYYKTTLTNRRKPLISIVIPNRDQSELLKGCLDSIFRHLTYPALEICIVENGSTEDATFAYYEQLKNTAPVPVRVLTWEQPFNYAALHNWAVPQCEGELILLLNNDTAVITPDWLERLSADCLADGVGAVGCRLLYADDTIQHAGVVIGLGGIAGHAFVGCVPEQIGYFGRAARKLDVSAVTAACMMIPKDIWTQIGGMDEQFVVAYNDIDLCLKVLDTGYRVMYDADVSLYHYKEKTRSTGTTNGEDNCFDSEGEYMRTKWNDFYVHSDPCYSPNLSLVFPYRLNTENL